MHILMKINLKKLLKLPCLHQNYDSLYEHVKTENGFGIKRPNKMEGGIK